MLWKNRGGQGGRECDKVANVKRRFRTGLAEMVTFDQILMEEGVKNKLRFSRGRFSEETASENSQR